MSNSPPFERQALVDKPAIVGAKWWHSTLVDGASKVVRRDAIGAIVLAGSALAGLVELLPLFAPSSSSSPKEDVKDDRKTALDMQKEYGWNFGFIGEPLVFDGVSSKPFDRSALRSIDDELRPSRTDLRPFYQPTLFQSPNALPKSLATAAPDDAALFRPLAEALVPISTRAMDAAYARGRSVAALFAAGVEAGGKLADTKTALVVDLPGPEAVAFAAGASRVFDPVFLFDNWPHPRGIVPAHQTLAAAAYYQPLFQKEASGAKATQRLPMFVLDRNRITAYSDDSNQFDNRYVAKLPWPAVAMSSLGVSKLLYVVPGASDTSTELDDLNDDFVGYQGGAVEVRALPLDAFDASGNATDAGTSVPRPSSAPGTRLADGETSDALLADSGWVYYGGRRTTHYAFWSDYGIGKPPRPATEHPASGRGPLYAPRPRVTQYSTGTGSASSKPRPTSFATVPVIVAVGTGAILGSKYSRSGSWNRASGGWGG